ncbi:MAG: glycosyltransferase family 9 protein [Planctomycetota bacterium]
MSEPRVPPTSALFVRLGAIGDVVNALTVATALREAAPATRIGWAVHPLSLPLVEGHPAVDRVHVWRRGGGARELSRLAREIRSARYELAADLQRLQKSALLARASGASRVLGFDRARCKESSWVWTRERIAPGPKREHMVLQYRRFLPLLGVPDRDPQHAFPHDAAAVAWAEGRSANGPSTLLNLGASKPEKRWPTASWRALAERLLAGDAGPLDGPILLTGGPGDADVAREVARGLDVVDLVGTTSLLQLLELSRRARRMVTADTGPMHMCAAVGTPVVALFGPSDPARTGPYGEGHVVLLGGEPLPRDLVVSYEIPREVAAMESTSVDAVVRAMADASAQRGE